MVTIVEQLVEWMSGRGNRSSRRKPAAVLLCPPQNTYDLARAGTRAATVENRRLAASATERHVLSHSVGVVGHIMTEVRTQYIGWEPEQVPFVAWLPVPRLDSTDGLTHFIHCQTRGWRGYVWDNSSSHLPYSSN
jgi:hypothetical protein